MTTHPSILAWRIPWTEEPGRLESTGLQRVNTTEVTYQGYIISFFAQSCPTLCNPMDCRLSGVSVHGIFQARRLEWIAISFSRGSSRPRNRTRVSCIAGRCFTVWATREAHWKGYIGGFQILVVMNKAAINTCVQGFVWTEVFNSKLNLERWSSVNEMDREKLNILDRENTAWLFREFHPDQHEVRLYRKE